MRDLIWLIAGWFCGKMWGRWTERRQGTRWGRIFRK